MFLGHTKAQQAVSNHIQSSLQTTFQKESSYSISLYHSCEFLYERFGLDSPEHLVAISSLLADMPVDITERPWWMDERFNSLSFIDPRPISSTEKIILGTEIIQDRKLKSTLARILREVYSDSTLNPKTRTHFLDYPRLKSKISKHDVLWPNKSIQTKASKFDQIVKRGNLGPSKLRERLSKWLDETTMPLSFAFYLYRTFTKMRGGNYVSQFLKDLEQMEVYILGLPTKVNSYLLVGRDNFANKRAEFHGCVVLNPSNETEFFDIHRDEFYEPYSKYINAMSNLTLFGKCGSKTTRIDKLHTNLSDEDFNFTAGQMPIKGQKFFSKSKVIYDDYEPMTYKEISDIFTKFQNVSSSYQKKFNFALSETDSRAEFMRKLNVMLSRKESLVQLVKGDAGSGKSIALLQLANRRISEIEKNLENESLSCPFWNIDPWKMIWDMIEIESHLSQSDIKIPLFMKARQASAVSHIDGYNFDSRQLTEFQFVSTPAMAEYMDQQGLNRFFEFVFTARKYHPINFMFFVDAIDEINDEETAIEFPNYLAGLRDIHQVWTIRPGFQGVEDLVPKENRHDLELSPEVLRRDMPIKLCEAWGISNGLASRYEELFDEYKEILTHPLYVGWFCFLIYTNNLLEDVKGTALQKRHRVIEQIVDIGIDAALIRRESPLKKASPYFKKKFKQKVKMFIALAHHHKSLSSVDIFEKMAHLKHMETTDIERQAIKSDCGILFLAGENIVWTHETVPELVYADSFFSQFMNETTASLFPGKPRISKPFLLRFGENYATQKQGSRITEKDELNQNILEAIRLLVEQFELSAQDYQRIWWWTFGAYTFLDLRPRGQYTGEKAKHSPHPRIDFIEPSDPIESALRKGFEVTHANPEKTYLENILSLLCSIATTVLNSGQPLSLPYEMYTQKAREEVIMFSKRTDLQDVLDLWTANEIELHTDTDLLLRRIRAKPELISNGHDLFHALGVLVDWGGYSIDQLRPFFKTSIPLGELLLDGTESYLPTGHGMGDLSDRFIREYNLKMYFFSRPHQLPAAEFVFWEANHHFLIDEDDEVLERLQQIHVELVYSNLFGHKEWKEKTRRLYSLAKKHASEINDLYYENFYIDYSDFEDFGLVRDWDQGPFEWISTPHFDQDVYHKGIALLPFISYVVGRIDEDVVQNAEDEFGGVIAEEAYDFVKSLGPEILNRFKRPGDMI